MFKDFGYKGKAITGFRSAQPKRITLLSLGQLRPRLQVLLVSIKFEEPVEMQTPAAGSSTPSGAGGERR